MLKKSGYQTKNIFWTPGKSLDIWSQYHKNCQIIVNATNCQIDVVYQKQPNKFQPTHNTDDISVTAHSDNVSTWCISLIL